MPINGGWVKLDDPDTGKTFYANHNTRQTQWDPPVGFIDPDQPVMKFTPPPLDDPSALPPDWEMMHDETSGRAFYVNHVTKKTTWERPISSTNRSSSSSNSLMDGNARGGKSMGRKEGTATGFGFIPAARTSSTSSRNGGGTHEQCRGDFGNSGSANNNNSMRWGGSSSSASSSRNNPVTAMPMRQQRYSSNVSVYDQGTSHAHSVPENDDKSSKYYKCGPGGMPQIDFDKVVVPDHLRPACPSCDIVFSIPLKRRHHCRLCADVFCDTCSSHRVLLPLEGAQYEKPVRICNQCNVDVDKGNYFTFRRYLIPLQLYDENTERPSHLSGSGKASEDDGWIGPDNVSGALTAMSTDFDALLLDPTSLSEKVSIPADVLVPAITRHLGLHGISTRAIRALSNLLALGNVAGDNSFALAVYTQADSKTVLDDMFNLLERSSTNNETLAVQEQTARALFYLTDGNVIRDLLVVDGGGGDSEDDSQAVEACDVHRSLRNMLDHTTSSESPSLQRWAAACIRNLLAEDYRRACDAVSEAMTTGNNELRHESFISHLVSSGGVMILSSLMGSDDGDTRAHATAALSATIMTARDIAIRINVWKEAFGIPTDGEVTCSDAAIIEAIVSSGACGLSLSQLLLSADDAVAEMGCTFASSLIQPILTTPQGSELNCYHRLLSSGSGGMNKLDTNEDSLGPYRKAALDLAINDGIVPALIQLIRVNSGGVGKKRPLELQRCAMEVLAAITLTVAYWDCKLRSAGSLTEGDAEWEQLTVQLHTAQAELEEEQVGEAILEAYNSAAVSSLNTSRDSLASQLREGASLIMGAMASFLPQVAALLAANHTITGLISVALDEGMVTASTLRGEWAPRRLAMLEASAMILIGGWKAIQKSAGNDNGQSQKDNTESISSRNWGNGGSSFGNRHINDNSSTSSSLDLLLEALDGGIIPLVSHIIDSPIEYHEDNKACSSIRVKIACCHIIAAIFGICECDKTNIGFVRLFEAIEVNSSNWGHQSGSMRNSNARGGGNGQNLISSAVSLLQSTANEARHYAAHEHLSGGALPILRLVEANLLCLGSICGASACSFSSSSRDAASEEEESTLLLAPPNKNHEYLSQVQMACISVCDVITKNSFLSSALVGIFGEGSVIPVLRLVSAIAEMGPDTVHADLAQTGFLVPITDMLRDAVVAGDYAIFTAAIAVISSCGPHITASAGETSNIKCLRDCIELLSNVLTIEESPSVNEPKNSALQQLKRGCIFAIERLSSNSSLWTTIASTFVPGVSQYLFGYIDDNNGLAPLDNANIGAALRAIQRVISLPTNARTVAHTGIGAALSSLICIRNDSDEDESYITKSSESSIQQIDYDVENLALQLLHSLAPFITAMCDHDYQNAGLIHSGAVDSACCSLSSNRDPVNTKLGLELFLSIISEVENIVEPMREAHSLLFVNTVMKHNGLIRRLCATILLSGEAGNNATEMEPIYGPALSLSEESCANFGSSLHAAVSVLFSIAAYCSLTDSIVNTAFWDAFFERKNRAIKDSSGKQASIVAACAVFLNYLGDEGNGICVPKDVSKVEYYQSVLLPCVRERLLYGLHTAFTEISALSGKCDEKDSPLQNVLHHFGVTQACLSMCTTSANIDSAFTVLETLLHDFPDITLSAICSENHSLATVFEMLSIATETDNSDTKPEMLRQFSALALSSAGKQGILGPATKRFGLRSVAIASLSAACLADELDTGECIEEDLAGSGLSIPTMCIRSLVGVLSLNDKTDEGTIILSSGEAKAISSSLGKKLSEIILARFMKHAEVQVLENDIDLDDNDNDVSVTESPEVLLLCALASRKEALSDLCAHGGLDALSLVAAEGETSAILALHEACRGDPSPIIDVEGHISVMQVIASTKNNASRDVELACMDLLVTLCTETKLGRDAVSDAKLCDLCIEFASRSLCNLTSKGGDDLTGNRSIVENQVDDSEEKKTKKKIDTKKLTKKLDTLSILVVEQQLPTTLASTSFLTALLCVPMCRETIFEDDRLRECLKLLALYSGPSIVQHAVIKFLLASARYVNKDCTEESYSVHFMSSIFHSVIESTHSGKSKQGFHESSFSAFNNASGSQEECNQNLVHASVCSAIECLLCYMTREQRSDITSTLQRLFTTLLDYATTPGKKLERKMRNSGILIYSITSVFVRLLGSVENIVLLLNTSLLNSFVKFTMINPPKVLPNDIHGENKAYWDCALNQCLQCLAVLTIEPYPDVDSGTSWKEIVSSAESVPTENKLSGRFQQLSIEMARKRPASQATTFISCLKVFIDDSSDPFRSITSKQILERLES